MKALQNAALVSTPEPQVLTALTSQQKTKYMKNFNNGRVVYAIIGVTNIDVKEEDGETYEVNLGPCGPQSLCMVSKLFYDFIFSIFHLMSYD
jgi:hypothetical protein